MADANSNPAGKYTLAQMEYAMGEIATLALSIDSLYMSIENDQAANIVMHTIAMQIGAIADHCTGGSINGFEGWFFGKAFPKGAHHE